MKRACQLSDIVQKERCDIFGDTPSESVIVNEKSVEHTMPEAAAGGTGWSTNPLNNKGTLNLDISRTSPKGGCTLNTIDETHTTY